MYFPGFRGKKFADFFTDWSTLTDLKSRPPNVPPDPGNLHDPRPGSRMTRSLRERLAPQLVHPSCPPDPVPQKRDSLKDLYGWVCWHGKCPKIKRLMEVLKTNICMLIQYVWKTRFYHCCWSFIIVVCHCCLSYWYLFIILSFIDMFINIFVSMFVIHVYPVSLWSVFNPMFLSYLFLILVFYTCSWIILVSHICISIILVYEILSFHLGVAPSQWIITFLVGDPALNLHFAVLVAGATPKLSLCFLPIGSMGLVYVPYIYHKMNKHQLNVGKYTVRPMDGMSMLKSIVVSGSLNRW